MSCVQRLYVHVGSFWRYSRMSQERAIHCGNLKSRLRFGPNGQRAVAPSAEIAPPPLWNCTVVDFENCEFFGGPSLQEETLRMWLLVATSCGFKVGFMSYIYNYTQTIPSRLLYLQVGCTVGRKLVKSTRWALGHLPLRSFAWTAHSFACSALLASLTRSFARLLANLLTLKHMGKWFCL